MKITKSKLKQMAKEELKNVIQEAAGAIGRKVFRLAPDRLGPFTHKSKNASSYVEAGPKGRGGGASIFSEWFKSPKHERIFRIFKRVLKDMGYKEVGEGLNIGEYSVAKVQGKLTTAMRQHILKKASGKEEVNFWEMVSNATMVDLHYEVSAKKDPLVVQELENHGFKQENGVIKTPVVRRLQNQWSGSNSDEVLQRHGEEFLKQALQQQAAQARQRQGLPRAGRHDKYDRATFKEGLVRKMKITKLQLAELIKEELEGLLKEGELADRKWQDNAANPDSPYYEKPIADPDSDSDDAAELRSGLDLTGFELKKERNGFYIIDSETGQKVLGPFRSEGQAEERRNDPALRDDYEAAKSILSKRMGDFSSEKNI